MKERCCKEECCPFWHTYFSLSCEWPSPIKTHLGAHHLISKGAWKFFGKKKTSLAVEAKKKTSLTWGVKKNSIVKGSEEKKSTRPWNLVAKWQFFEKKLHPPVRFKKKTSSIWGVKNFVADCGKKKKKKIPTPTSMPPPTENQNGAPFMIQFLTLKLFVFSLQGQK